MKKRSGPSGSGRTQRSRIPRLRRPAIERGTSRNSTRRKIEGAAASTSRTTLLIGAVSLVVVGAAITSVIVLPLQTYLGQGDEIDRLETELERMTAINDDLQAEVDRLRTDTGVKEAARDQLGYVSDGDERETILPFPDLPTDLPNGWPYGVIDEVMSFRMSNS
ncbi:MAG: septum formation initiator family protein [Actinomycetota bacterium]|nr:septum formation initiator family protein [Actinomycetota bacterium]